MYKSLEKIFLISRQAKSVHLVTIFVLLFIKTQGQKQYPDIIYEAYIQNNIETWKNVCDKMQKSQNLSRESQINLINFQYGLIAWCIANKKNKDGLMYLGLAETKLQEISDRNSSSSVINSYKSAFSAFRAGLDNTSTVKSGLKSLEYADLAIKEDSTNYFAYFQRANIYRHTPQVFNGSKKKALEYYQKAESLIKMDTKTRIANWNYINLLVSITETYIETKNYIAAKKYCDKILKIEPEFYLAKDTIWPKIRKNLK